MKLENSVESKVVEAAEGSHEHDGINSMRRDLSDFDLQLQAANKEEQTDPLMNSSSSSDSMDALTNDRPRRDEEGIEAIQRGHSCDSGMGRKEFLGSPKLKRRCSSLDTLDMLKTIANQFSPSSSCSFGDLQNSVRDGKSEFIEGIQARSLSVMTSCSADKVILRRQLSTQVLPSRSKRLFWNLFFRHLHKPVTASCSSENNSDQNASYSSDT